MKKRNPCDGCSLCCRHIAVEIDAPESEKDYDEIRWFLLHRDVWVFVDDDGWNLQVNTPCEKLDDKGWCTYYEKRPGICKDYSSENCEKHGDGDSFKVLWKDVNEFDEWVGNGKVIPED